MTANTETKAHVARQLTAAWDDWEAHPRAATPLFRRDDALTDAAYQRAGGTNNHEIISMVAARIRDSIMMLRRRRIPTADAVRQVLDNPVLAKRGGPAP